MKRFLGVLAAAFVGATLGHTVRQLVARQLSPSSGEERELTIGAPLTNLALATGIGMAAGRRAACCTGMVISLALGSKLDEMTPVIGEWHERAHSLAAEAGEHLQDEVEL